MSNLSELLPSGAGGKTAEFVASGTLTNGQAVILNSNGSVTAVGLTPSSGVVIPETSSPVNFDSGDAQDVASQFHPTRTNVLVISYRDGGNSNYGTCVVGTVNGSSISFGTPVVFESAASYHIAMRFDPSNPTKFVAAYMDQGNSNYGTAIMGAIAGDNALTFGSPSVFNSASTADKLSVDFIASNKFAIAYQDSGNSEYGTAIVGTVSGSNISYGSEYAFNSGSTYEVQMKADPNNSNVFVVIYLDSGDSNKGKSRVGTVSGSTISYGSVAIYSSASISGSQTNQLSFDKNTANKLIILFVSSSALKGVIATRSSTNLSFGSAATIKGNNVTFTSVSYNPNTANQLVVAYRNNGDANKGTATVCTVSSSTINVGASYIYNPVRANYNSLAFDSNNSGKFAVSFNNATGPVGSSILGNLSGTINTTNLTATNFIGIPDKAYASGDTATVAVQGGVSTNQTSLTVGSTYFVQDNGTLGTSAGTVTVEAGRAMSATSILIKGNK